MIEQFVGHRSEVACLLRWLKDLQECFCYAGDEEELPHYAIIYGTTGNGKTFLAQLLAQETNAELLSICAFDIEKSQDLNDWIKKINFKPMVKPHKIILVDDIDEFSKPQQKVLIEIIELSHYPILYISNIYELPQDFKNGSLKNNKQFIVINKPLSSELEEHLMEKAKEWNLEIPPDTISMIAKQSKSVRSAEQSLLTQSVNEIVDDSLETGNQFLKTITERKLIRPINRENIRFVFDNIKGYDIYALKIMKLFSDFDYRIKVQFQEIDPIFVNEAKEPLEKVKIFYKFRPKEKMEKSDTEVLPEKKKPNLKKWGL